MLKKIMLLSAFVFAATFANAQKFDVAVNPLAALFGKYSVTGEYIISDNMGAELGLSLINRTLLATKYSGFGADISFKYYFSPDEGADKFYVFPYLTFNQYSFDTDFVFTSGTTYKTSYTNFGIGGGVGYKWVASSNLLFDIGFGYGRDIVSNVTLTDAPTGIVAGDGIGLNFYSKLAIGYRF